MFDGQSRQTETKLPETQVLPRHVEKQKNEDCKLDFDTGLRVSASSIRVSIRGAGFGKTAVFRSGIPGQEQKF